VSARVQSDDASAARFRFAAGSSDAPSDEA
jgi:hypothetical protein